jgi:hypothetical protein
VSSTGEVFTITNTGEIYKHAADGTHTIFASGLGRPDDLAIDTKDNLYTVDTPTDKVFKITPTGTVTTLANVATGSSAKKLCVDKLGNVYVACFNTTKVNKITPTGVVS